MNFIGQAPCFQGFSFINNGHLYKKLLRQTILLYFLSQKLSFLLFVLYHLLFITCSLSLSLYHLLFYRLLFTAYFLPLTFYHLLFITCSSPFTFLSSATYFLCYISSYSPVCDPAYSPSFSLSFPPVLFSLTAVLLMAFLPFVEILQVSDALF